MKNVGGVAGREHHVFCMSWAVELFGVYTAVASSPRPVFQVSRRQSSSGRFVTLYEVAMPGIGLVLAWWTWFWPGQGGGLLSCATSTMFAGGECQRDADVRLSIIHLLARWLLTTIAGAATATGGAAATPHAATAVAMLRPGDLMGVSAVVSFACCQA